MSQIFYLLDTLYEPCVPLLPCDGALLPCRVSTLLCTHMQIGGRAVAGVLHPPLLLFHCSDLPDRSAVSLPRARCCRGAFSHVLIKCAFVLTCFSSTIRDDQKLLILVKFYPLVRNKNNLSFILTSRCSWPAGLFH